MRDNSPFRKDVKFESSRTRGISGPARRRTESKARPACIASTIKLSDEKRQCQLSCGAARIATSDAHLAFRESTMRDSEVLKLASSRPSPWTPIPDGDYSLNTRSSRQPPLGVSSFQPIKATKSPRASSKRTSSCFSRGLPIWLKHSCWPRRRRASQR